MMNRREFLWSMPAAAALPALAAKGKRSLGLEIYSLRFEIKKDLPKAIASIRKLGFEQVEVPDYYGLGAAGFGKLLASNGLKATALITLFDHLDQKMPQMIDDARTLGVSYLVCPWIPHGQQFTAEDCKRAAAKFNQWSEAVRKQKLTLCYHPHGYEFAKSPEGTLCDTLIRATKSSGMMYELDTFWTLHGGEDPTALLLRYPDRFPLVHLKDMVKGTPTGVLTGQAPDETSSPLGAGMVNFPQFLAAADKCHVVHYYVEDEHQEAARQLPQSMAYLKTVGF